mmetsp:Transcript_3906/g.11105  ORF Transcript_3906/g.11105 Transcript_3906/m.11105 type:complete len:346 (+) Transcript_3906:65-1102(+)
MGQHICKDRKVLPHNERHCEGETKGCHQKLMHSASMTGNWSESIKHEPHSMDLYREYQGLLEGVGAQYASLGGGFQQGDCLLIIAMQNDFIPKMQAPDGGRFGVAEGASAMIPIADMVRKAAAAEALIVATRDYHPKTHCSFVENQGPFPSHCIQGSKGSFLYGPTKAVLSEVRDQGAEVMIAFKGFHPGCDSFGGLQYGPVYFNERHLGNELGTQPTDELNGCCALEWTGGFALTCSNIEEDLDAPPDVLAVLDRRTLAEILQEHAVKRLFVCGLALDFCVLDSSLNAATAGLAKDGVFLVTDAARAAHIPGIGTFGSGFLSDPASVVNKTKVAGVKLIRSDAI